MMPPMSGSRIEIGRDPAYIYLFNLPAIKRCAAGLIKRGETYLLQLFSGHPLPEGKSVG